jgi:hypothetical protein
MRRIRDALGEHFGVFDDPDGESWRRSSTSAQGMFVKVV